MIYKLLFAAGALLTADTLLLSFFSNGNLGIMLPAVFGVPLMIISVFRDFFASWFSTHVGSIVKWILVCGYCALILFFVIMFLFLSSSAEKKAEYNKDVLIVLGCGVRGERVSLTLKYRLDAALEYLEQSPDTVVIVSGGKGYGEKISEAEAMKRYLISHGIDEGRVIMEERSTSTWENFKFSSDIINERLPGAETAFVTTSFHVYRAGRIASIQGIPADGYAAKDIWYSSPNNYMRESIAVAAYKLLGRI